MLPIPSVNGHAANGAPRGFKPVLPLPSGNGVDGPTTHGDLASPAPRAPSPSGNGVDGRDSRGRFAKGNKLGRGNPFHRRVAGLRSLLLELVTEDALRGIVAKLVEKARAGDLAAAKVVLLYLIGRPADCVDPDRVALDEWRLYQASPTTGELLDGQSNRLDLESACTLARLLQDRNVEKILAQLGHSKDAAP